MLTSTTPPARALRGVAIRVSVLARHPGIRLGGASKQRVGIGETFELWTVDDATLRDHPDDVDLRDLARPTSRWHHQLRGSGRPSDYYARSSRVAYGRGVELVRSPLARAIDRRVSALDDLGDVSGDVRLLVVPATGLTALWIVPRRASTESMAIVVHAPRGLRLPTARLIRSAVLIRRLSKMCVVRGRKTLI
jgi:hypothetical protein